MAIERRPDLVLPPATRPQRPFEADRRLDEEVVSGEHRLAVAIRGCRDEASLLSLLGALPLASRLTARVVLVRELGGGRAAALCERAFGRGKAAFPAVDSVLPPPATP